MTRKNKPRTTIPQAKPTTVTQVVNAQSLISKALDKSTGLPLYANHAQFLMSDKEISIDFYFMGLSHQGKAEAVFLQRIVVPLVLGKGFATGLANAIANYELGENVILPNSRSPFPEDKITIWP